ncbi:MAG TPA: GNAT family N-acetyltransferase [Verrucomicrobiae bacterium]
MFSIRVAKAADAIKIARIHVNRWRVTSWGRISGAGRSVKQRETFWRERLGKGKGSVFVIESGDIVGFCDLVPSRDKDTDPKTVSEIAAVYVKSDDWRLGAGKALCYHVLSLARKQVCSAIIVWIGAANTDAMRFYDSLGFARDGAIKIETAPDGSNLYENRYRIKLKRPDQT